MRVLYLITARGGSKGVPNKNLRRLGGLSLVAFKARAAQRSKYCTRLILSTDSRDIQEEARALGVEVPFTRPAELASDTAKSADVIAHAMRWIVEEGGEPFDAVMLLEPSAPFSRPRDLDEAVRLLADKGAKAVVGIRPAEVSSVYVGPMDPDGRLTPVLRKMKEASKARRQELRPEYTMNGALYVFRWDYFQEHGDIYHDEDGVFGHLMPSEYSVEIDEMRDLHFAEFLVERGHVDMSNWQ